MAHGKTGSLKIENRKFHTPKKKEKVFVFEWERQDNGFGKPI